MRPDRGRGSPASGDPAREIRKALQESVWDWIPAFAGMTEVGEEGTGVLVIPHETLKCPLKIHSEQLPRSS